MALKKASLACTVCGSRNYSIKLSSTPKPTRLEVNKYCKHCSKYTLHKETRQEIVIGGKGRVIACDILDMNPIVGVDFLQGDFRDENVLNALLERVGEAKVDVVMSDMAPNFSGMPSVDIPRAMYLVELALDMCKQVLAKKGSFVVKVFQGEGFDEYLREIRSLFSVVKVRKPEASRGRSREVYIVASGYKGEQIIALIAFHCVGDEIVSRLILINLRKAG